MISAPAAVKRVITTFILCHERQRVAVLHRCSTMPTFAGHWAGVSGSIEPNETPIETAQRELDEETNLGDVRIDAPGGLFVDVQSEAFGGRIIRVYPFTVRMPPGRTLELRGTEHDAHQFVTAEELNELGPCVPGLADAFHHATFGRHLDLPPAVRLWEADRVSGAASLARKAVELAADDPVQARHISILRPSMVPIVNAMNRIAEGEEPDRLLRSLKDEVDRCVQIGVDAIRGVPRKNDGELVVATFSRSSTIAAVLKRIQAMDEKTTFLCGESTPGNEGVLMASDLGASCIPDDELNKKLSNGEVDVVVVGSDCVLNDAVVNKVGTKTLAMAARSGGIPVYCCTDRLKLWADVFPPPLEDIFELIPAELFDRILLPPSAAAGTNTCTNSS